ncbi:MAG TPA: glycosyltransferase family 4 protein [Solirubrobacteraceae bacterium]|nr:glycosyltransferase family 4 protein [Solirubrobacteraceae bacterium]
MTAGIHSGLRELGVVTLALDMALPGGLERTMLAAAAAPTRNRYDAEGARLMMCARSLLARRRLRGASLDGVIQIGTTFILPRGTSYVTLEDMTLRQGGDVHPVFSRMSTRGIDGWEGRRAGIYDRARNCAVASHWAADSLLGDYGLGSERVAVVGFGANHRGNVLDRDWRSPRFLFVGIDWQRKGGPQVLSAFARVRQVHPDAILDVVGGHPPLGEAGVNAHGVLSRERDRDAMIELFARATCFVMPSLVEPFGIAYVEAASAGVPSIGSSLGGPRDVIGSDGGVLVEPGDEEELVGAMLHLADPVVAQHMGAAARERSLLYTWPKVAERLLRALGLQAPDGRALAKFL